MHSDVWLTLASHALSQIPPSKGAGIPSAMPWLGANYHDVANTRHFPLVCTPYVTSFAPHSYRSCAGHLHTNSMQGGGAPAAEGTERRRRLLALSCSLLSLVLLLGLLSSPSASSRTAQGSASPSTTVHTGRFEGPAPTSQPTAALSQQVSRIAQAGDFPSNVTGGFRGLWNMKSPSSTSLKELGGGLLR